MSFLQINFDAVSIICIHALNSSCWLFYPSESENAEWSWLKVKPEAVPIQPLTWMNMEKQILA